MTVYVGYDVIVLIELVGGHPLSNLLLLNNTFEPGSCSQGTEEYNIVESHIVRLSQLFSTCDAQTSFTAQVYYTDYTIMVIFLNFLCECTHTL